jgi:AcrR family transcriptional regulator
MNATRDPAWTLVECALKIGEKHSWEAVRLYDVAIAAGATLDDVRAHFREKEDLVDAWFDRADAMMLQDAAAPDFLRLVPRARLHRVIMVWLDALEPHRKVTREMILAKCEPGHIHIQVPAVMRISRTVQWMREAAHRDATYIHRALEESVLTSIYLATFVFWMGDTSPGSSRTRRFLKGKLAMAEGAENLMRDLLTPLRNLMGKY